MFIDEIRDQQAQMLDLSHARKGTVAGWYDNAPLRGNDLRGDLRPKRRLRGGDNIYLTEIEEVLAQ